MPWAEVGAGSQRNQTSAASADSTTLVFPANVAADSLLVVAGACWAVAGAPASVAVTDTLTTAYTVLDVANVGNVRYFIARGLAPSAGACTVTVNPDGAASDFSFSIDEFSGSHATPLDVDGGSSTGTSTTPSDGITTVTADDLLIGVMTHVAVSSPTLTKGADYTQIGEIENNLTTQCHHAEFRIVTTAQAYTVDWTVGASVAWGCYTAAFKEAVAAAGQPTMRRWGGVPYQRLAGTPGRSW